MRVVLTLHGVGTFGGRGPWQDSVDQVLGPHFECTAIKYSHYRWLGLFTAVVEPWVLGPGILLSVLVWLLHLVTALYPWLIVSALLSVLAARIRHEMCIQHFLKESYRAVPLGMRPHVIAHSMGTKVVGTVLRTYPQTKFSNLIFAGCVLPTDYPWERINLSNASRFRYIRNEVGGRDVVPRLAALGARLHLLPGYGVSGGDGFAEVAGLIHSVAASAAVCARCVIRGAAVKIHNVICDEFGHGSVFDSESYASSFWLPFLWGIEPMEYADFLERCLQCEEHHTVGDWAACRRAEERLLDREWGWAEGMTLRKYIEEKAKSHPYYSARPVPVVGQVLRKVWQDVVFACRANQERGPGWEDKIVALHPVRAVIRGVNAMLV